MRAHATAGLQRMGWLFLTSVAAGASVWCTHFIAVLAFKSDAPVSFDPVLTISSLLIAIVGTSAGFAVATSKLTRLSPALGGALVGLAIAAMHYCGMLAYRVEGIVSWSEAYILSSIVLSVGLSAIAMVFAARRRGPNKYLPDKYLAAATLVLAIVSLHFTGMTAFHVVYLHVPAHASNPAALQALALAVAAVGLTIVGTGLASYLIDDLSRTDSIVKLRHMALNDGLTGLPNRASFNDRLALEIDHAAKTGGAFAVIVLDLNKFKDINDMYGHGAGDEVLKVAGQRLNGLLKEREFVARLGGDEFAALCRLDTRSDLNGFVARLEAALLRPVVLNPAALDEGEVVVGASIGVACYPQDATTKEVLMNNADLAMYRAKTSMIENICFYEPSMDENVRARRALANDLRAAMENDELDIHYQLQTSILTGEAVGYEALLRWHHPVRGNVPPMDFIPLAEENGLILPLGEWVLRRACATAASWPVPLKVAVNLSPVQFAHANLPELVHEILISTGLSPRRLELELTESTIIGDKMRSLHILRQIKALGVSVSLDDFGTGYSSLDTLRTFPFDKIKLDRSFMSEIETSPQAKAIIRAVLALGKSLNVSILAEGIETQCQLAILAAEGCDEGQGYFIARPAPSGQIGAGEAGMPDITTTIVEPASPRPSVRSA